jgi:hypothetical protein
MSKKRNRPSRQHPAKPAASPAPKASGRPAAGEEAGPAAAGPATGDARDEADSAGKGSQAAADKASHAAAGKGSQRGKPAALPEARAKLGKPLPPRPPVFWFGFELPWAKLVAVRFVLFGLLAIDAFLQLSHAPRYGAGDFNVGHLPFLHDLGPGRAGYEIGQLIVAYLFVLAALGVATRLVLPIAAALYAWLSFGSQLDSYQHHYLVALVVAFACFVPWQRPADAAPETPVRSWAVRLILVQLGIMYLWAAISKMDPAWTSGRTLDTVLTGSVRSLVDGTIGMERASSIAIGIELILACTIWLRPTWRIAAPLGLLFHIGIAASGLEIGLFAYLMIGMYLLVLPDSLFVWLAGTPPLQPLRRLLRRLGEATSWLAWALAIGAGIAIAALVRLEHPLHAGLAVAAIPLALAVHARLLGRRPALSLAAAHLAALLLWLGAERVSSVAVDYYKFWAGSQRRLGNLPEAEHAYRRLVEVAPDLELGHYYLGRILTSSGRGEEGVPHLHEAQRLETGRARAWIEEARWLASQGQHADAITKARQGTFAEPNNREARSLLESLLANQAAPARAAEEDQEKL